MIILSDARLAILAVPKTGTTALEGALRHHSDIIFQKGRKHITAQRFKNRIGPFLERTWGERLETVAVMREPMDQLGSWYRYRGQPRHAHTNKSTQEMTFAKFVRATLRDRQPPFAHVGSQFRFLTDGRGQLCVTHLFSYDAQPLFLEFLSQKLGFEVEFARENVSPMRPLDLPPKLEAHLRTARAKDFELFDHLTDAGGYLGPGWTKIRAPLPDLLARSRPRSTEKPLKVRPMMPPKMGGLRLSS